MPLTVLSVGFPLAKVAEATAGGAEQVLLTLDKVLVRMGHRSLVLAPRGSRCHGLLIPAQVPFSSFDERAKREAWRIFKREIGRALRRQPVDVVHMHGLDFADYLPECGVPVIVTLHLPLAWYGRDALRPRPGVKLVCVSETQARAAPSYAQIASVIPNGVSLEQFNLRRKGNYVLAMGRICPEKAFHRAIDAAQTAEQKLIIAGAVFPYREHQVYFEKLMQPRLGANAVFIGPVGGTRKAHLLAGAKCLLIPSSAPETSSLIAMEAMAAGTPVVAMRTGALTEIVREGKTGLLVNTVEEMAQAISEVGIIDAQECRQEAERRFGAERMVADYLELYSSSRSGASVQELEAA